jgi:hypothetical protein
MYCSCYSTPGCYRGANALHALQRAWRWRVWGAEREAGKGMRRRSPCSASYPHITSPSPHSPSPRSSSSIPSRPSLRSPLAAWVHHGIGQCGGAGQTAARALHSCDGRVARSRLPTARCSLLHACLVPATSCSLSNLYIMCSMLSSSKNTAQILLKFLPCSFKIRQET